MSVYVALQIEDTPEQPGRIRTGSAGKDGLSLWGPYRNWSTIPSLPVPSWDSDSLEKNLLVLDYIC